MEKGVKKSYQHTCFSEYDELIGFHPDSKVTLTENCSLTYSTTEQACLDLFAQIGALRGMGRDRILSLFSAAYQSDPTLAMRILFFGRDVRGGLGERNLFHICMTWLAKHHPESAEKVIPYIAEYGRYDDLLCMLHTRCDAAVIRCIRVQLDADLAALQQDGTVSMLGKWLPSINTSNSKAVAEAKYLARKLGMNAAGYRKMLSALRRKIAILENYLRERDYSFDYEKQPSKAMLRYRAAFLRNDAKRYRAFLDAVSCGEKQMHTGTLYPYEVIRPIFDNRYLLAENDSSYLGDEGIKALDTTWNALPDYTNDENALVVMDGSGSMYGFGSPAPIEVAVSLAIYYAERNKGAFHNRFITFSKRPHMVEVNGDTIFDKVQYCTSYCEAANTNLSAVFDLILQRARRYRVKREEMPKRLYIISDMEFDACVEDASISDFWYAKAKFASHGYVLPEIVFWNVQSRHGHLPVADNDRGVALVSGSSPRLFELLKGDVFDPYSAMMQIVCSERYQKITA